MTGPKPEINPPLVGSFGEKKKLWTMLPRPFCTPPGRNPVWLTTGMIVREIRFQSAPIENGMTGWMLI